MAVHLAAHLEASLAAQMAVWTVAHLVVWMDGPLVGSLVVCWDV